MPLFYSQKKQINKTGLLLILFALTLRTARQEGACWRPKKLSNRSLDTNAREQKKSAPAR